MVRLFIHKVDKTHKIGESQINASQWWTPKLEINTNKKSTKGPGTIGQTNRRTDILYCHRGYLNPWPADACAAHNYGLCALIVKNRHGRPDKETERWINGYKKIYKIDCTPLGSSGPQCLENPSRRCTPTLEINTNKKIAKGPWITGRTDGNTDEHIILPLRVYEPVACGCMNCKKLQAA